MLNPAANDVPPATMVADQFSQARAATVALASGLSPEDCQVQSMPDASPAKWHLAHTSWFFETFLLQGDGYRPFNPDFEYLFNSYYNTVGAQPARAGRGLVTRPSLTEVYAYREWVDAQVGVLLQGSVDARTAALVELGIHHEQQHQELLLTDIQHVFWCNPMKPAFGTKVPGPAPAEVPARFVAHPGGLAMIGAPADGFAFDNERPAHRVWLEPFEIGNRLVTNSEFRVFIDAGGYRNHELWLSDAWTLVCDEQWRKPLYWSDELDRAFTLAGTQTLDPDAPVCHLSFFEADAYARWAGARLPTEAEWEASAATDDLAQCFGAVWQWTASAYLGYPGFRPSAGSIGEYNGKFMSGQMVLRGSSCLTSDGHARLSYRNFFPPATRWQCAGLRLARDA